MSGNVWELARSKSVVHNALTSETDTKNVRVNAVLKTSTKEANARTDPINTNKAYLGAVRSKSPAANSIHKMRSFVLDRFGISKKERMLSLSPENDLQWIQLSTICIMPVNYEYKSKKPLEVLSVPELSHASDLDEKCAYLFRSNSFMDSEPIFTNEVHRVHMYDRFCPVHGSQRILNRKFRLNGHERYHLASIDQVDIDDDAACALLNSGAYAAKFLRKRKKALISVVEKFRNDKARRKIKTNLWIISFAFLFLFIAFHGLQNLQTSVNGRLGSDHLCIYYLAVSISSLFVPTFMLNRLGCKLTLITSVGIYMIYMLSNFLPKYYSLIPTALLTGVAGSCLWAAKWSYILETATKYAKLNFESPSDVILRFFGYFFMIVHLGQVIGNLLSSLILTSALGYDRPLDRVEKTCGYLFQENTSFLSEQAAYNLRRLPPSVYSSVCMVYMCCTVVALMIIVFFLNSLKKDEHKRAKMPAISFETVKTILRNFTKPKLLLLVPLTIFNGLEQAFIIGMYTKSYVACGLGISQIGFVMTSFGAADAICSLIFGPLLKLFGRMPLFVFGAVINMLTFMTLLIWPLNPGDTMLFYAIAGVWGMADGVWNTQISGFWIALTGTNVMAAFANYQFWESLGFSIGLLLFRFRNTAQYLIICFVALFIGMAGYAGIEFYDDTLVSIK